MLKRKPIFNEIHTYENCSNFSFLLNIIEININHVSDSYVKE